MTGHEWEGRKLARVRVLAVGHGAVGAHRFLVELFFSVSVVRMLRFQLPPVKPCMRFSRTRLTDVLHRRRSTFQARKGLGVRAAQPHAAQGKAWRPVTSPRRLRATYNRRHGVTHMLAALDLTTGRIHYRIRRRKRHREFLDLLKALRRQWPEGTLHLIMDNFSPQRHPGVRAWARDNDVELVFLPTYGFWLNWIEAEFAALRYFALGGTDHLSHAEQNAAIASFIRWRNARAAPKAGFATDSPIRTWTHCPAKVA